MEGRPLTLGTAGHIDHGKTTLIKALTGRDTDRLKEEKERGISIELGFAELELPSGRRMSVVDVPGHERFVRTMVSGATGIDLFMLVVAADDGVMPQTREHLRIIELLGIPVGVAALTKIDLVDEELAELAAADIEDFLQTTRYSGTPVIPVSAVTGEGIDRLLAALEEVAGKVPPRPTYPATRMPVDRVFSLKGIGTVVTGTLWSGSIGTDDTVAVLPARDGRDSPNLRSVRVRSLQVHDREVSVALGGQRVALNLTGVARDEVGRGQWVVKDPAIDPTYLADVRLTLLADVAGALPRISRARVDHGTAEILAKVVLIDRDVLEPGNSCYAQIRFEEKVLVYPGDQFILRSVTPVGTIGGGQVIDPAPRKHGAGPEWRERLMVLEDGSAEAVAGCLLKESFPGGLSRGALEASPYLWRFSPADISKVVAAMLAGGCAVAAGSPPVAEVGTNTRLYWAPSLASLAQAAREALQAKAESDELDPYLSLGELRRQLTGGREASGLEVALEQLQAVGEVLRTEYGYVWAQAAAAMDGTQDEALERLWEQFAGESTGSASGEGSLSADTPSVATAAEAVGLTPADARRMIESLVRRRRLVKVGDDLYYAPERLEELIGLIVTAIESRGEITLAEVRDLLCTSRRYAQALLEHMDSQGLTLRVGEARRLRRRR